MSKIPGGLQLVCCSEDHLVSVVNTFLSSGVWSRFSRRRIYILSKIVIFLIHYSSIVAVISTNVCFFLRLDGVILSKIEHFFPQRIAYVLTQCLCCSFFNLPVMLVMISP